MSVMAVDRGEVGNGDLWQTDCKLRQMPNLLDKQKRLGGRCHVMAQSNC